MKLSAYCKKKREERNITQWALAKEKQVNPGYLYQIENQGLCDTKKTRISTIARILNVYDIDNEELTQIDFPFKGESFLDLLIEERQQDPNYFRNKRESFKDEYIVGDFIRYCLDELDLSRNITFNNPSSYYFSDLNESDKDPGINEKPVFDIKVNMPDCLAYVYRIEQKTLRSDSERKKLAQEMTFLLGGAVSGFFAEPLFGKKQSGIYPEKDEPFDIFMLTDSKKIYKCVIDLLKDKVQHCDFGLHVFYIPVKNTADYYPLADPHGIQKYFLIKRNTNKKP